MKRSRVAAAWIAAVSNPYALWSPVAGFAASLMGALPARGADMQFAERVISSAADATASVFATDVALSRICWGRPGARAQACIAGGRCVRILPITGL